MIDKKLEELLKQSVTKTLQEKNVLGKYSQKINNCLSYHHYFMRFNYNYFQC